MALFCVVCGNSIMAEDRFCRVCGRQVSATSAAGAPGVPTAVSVGPAETSGKAIISLVCGLLFIVAIVFGHLGMSEIRKSSGRLKGEGMAIAGLVLGYLWIAAIPMILIVAAIAIPNLLRARIAANESSAVASIHSVITAEITYAQSHPKLGFTCSMSDLAGDGLISNQLAGGSKTGYAFELTDCSARAEGTGNAKYRVVAYPMTANTTGRMAFCSDESAVIRVNSDGSARGCVENGSPLQ
jgi:type IV pilus assembly protein PilA